MKMKKLLFLLVPTLLSISWIDLPTEPIIENDPIIGTWTFEKIYHVYPDGTKKEIALNKCVKKIRHTYNTDGTLSYKMFKTDKKAKRCIEKDKAFWKGKWKKISDNKYKLDHVRTYPSGYISSNTDSTEIYEFSNKNNTLIKYINYKRDGYAMHPDVKEIGEIKIFKRIIK